MDGITQGVSVRTDQADNNRSPILPFGCLPLADEQKGDTAKLDSPYAAYLRREEKNFEK